MYFDNSELNEAQLKIYYTFLSADGVCGKEELEKLDSICQKMDISEARKSEIMNIFTNDSISSSSNEGRVNAIAPNMDSMLTSLRSALSLFSEDQTLFTEYSTQTSATPTLSSTFNEDQTLITNDDILAEQALNIIDDILADQALNTIDCILEEQSSYSTMLTDKSVQTNIIWNLINLGYSDTSFSDPEKRIVKHLASRWNIDDVIVADLIDTAETMLSICEQKEWLKTTKQPYDMIDGKIRELDQVMKHLAENVEITVSESEIA